MTEMIKTTLNGEFEIVLPKHRAERPEWHSEDGWEKPRLKSMYKHIGNGDVVYYVGAEEESFQHFVKCGVQNLYCLSQTLKYGHIFH